MTTQLSRRDFVRTLGVTGLGLFAAAYPIAALAAETGPDVSFVHPELREVARSILAYFGSKQPSGDSLSDMRNGGKMPTKPLIPDVPVAEQRIPVPGGAPDVLVYLINAKPDKLRPAIIQTHGGGFVAGTARNALRDMQELAVQLDCMVASVDYRLAPETRYTGSIEDNYAALRWVHNNAATLGVDTKRIAVMGESAGGGHAALLALTARDRGEVPLCYQMLIYPMLDDRTGSTRPVGPNIGKIIWTAESNRFGWECFLGQKPGGRRVPAAAVPARVANLAGLPPAFIGVGGIDLFVDEDIDYAKRLADASVPTELIVVPGAFHGFDAIGSATGISRRFNEAKIAALKGAFAAQF